MKTAKKIRELDGFKGEAALYEMSPPYEGHQFVVVSAISIAFDTGRSETYIFPSDAKGKVTDWGELEGSRRGTTSHSEILEEAGYEVEA